MIIVNHSPPDIFFRYHVTYGNGLIRYVGSANVDGLGVESLNQAIDDLTDFTTEM